MSSEPAIPDELPESLEAFADELDAIPPYADGWWHPGYSKMLREAAAVLARLPGPGDTEVEAQRRRADAIKKLYDDQFRRYSWQSARINQLRDEIIRLGGTVPEYSPGVVSAPAAQPANDDRRQALRAAMTDARERYHDAIRRLAAESDGCTWLNPAECPAHGRRGTAQDTTEDQR